MRAKSVSRRAALTGAAAKPKRLSPKDAAWMHESISANAEHAHNLIEAAWRQSKDISPLIVQAVFRELMIDIGAVHNQANLWLRGTERGNDQHSHAVREDRRPGGR